MANPTNEQKTIRIANELSQVRHGIEQQLQGKTWLPHHKYFALIGRALRALEDIDNLTREKNGNQTLSE